MTRHVVFDDGIAAPEVSQFSARIANLATPALHQGQKLRGVITWEQIDAARRSRQS